MNDCIELCKKLIRCESVTPNDAGCQDILTSRLLNAGFDVQQLPFGNVSNIWATHGNGEPLLCFAGHTDVVPPGEKSDWETPPFEPTTKGDSLYGRGAADMKSGIAAMVIACEKFVAQHPNHKGTIALLITSDEEGDAINGTRKVLDHLKHQNIDITYCIVGEPSSQETLGDQIRIGRRGSLHGYLTLSGTQGHVAYPEKFSNLLHQSVPLLQSLTSERWDEGTDNFPPTSFQLINVESNSKAGNTTSSQFKIHFNLRFNTCHTAKSLQEKIEKLIQTHTKEYCIQWKLSAKPFYTAKDSKLVEAVLTSAASNLAQTPTLSTAGGTSDGRFFATTGAEIVELGVINKTIHQANESVKLDDIERLSQTYQHIIEQLLR